MEGKNVDGTCGLVGLKANGSLVVWGKEKPEYARYRLEHYRSLSTITGICTIENKAVAVISKTRDVVVWGRTYIPSTGVSAMLNNVESVCACSFGFAVLRGDGRAIVWGADSWCSTTCETPSVSDLIHGTLDEELRDVIRIFSYTSIIFALRRDKRVIAINLSPLLFRWGRGGDGITDACATINGNVMYLMDGPDGKITVRSRKEESDLYTAVLELNGIKAIFSTKYSFATLSGDGTATFWHSGEADHQGYDIPGGRSFRGRLSRVLKLESHPSHFLVTKDDGTFVVVDEDMWG